MGRWYCIMGQYKGCPDQHMSDWQYDRAHSVDIHQVNLAPVVRHRFLYVLACHCRQQLAQDQTFIPITKQKRENGQWRIADDLEWPRLCTNGRQPCSPAVIKSPSTPTELQNSIRFVSVRLMWNWTQLRHRSVCFCSDLFSDLSSNRKRHVLNPWQVRTDDKLSGRYFANPGHADCVAAFPCFYISLFLPVRRDRKGSRGMATTFQPVWMFCWIKDINTSASFIALSAALLFRLFGQLDDVRGASKATSATSCDTST